MLTGVSSVKAKHFWIKLNTNKFAEWCRKADVATTIDETYKPTLQMSLTDLNAKSDWKH